MSKRLLRLGFDTDGVLADFITGFLALVNRECGTSYTSPQWTEYGGADGPSFMTPQQWRAGWAALKREPYFWANLKPTTSLLSLINKGMVGLDFHGYFFTKRMDLATAEPGDALLLTTSWLESHFIRNFSGVLVTNKQSRVSLLRACEIDSYLEDWGEQFLEVQAAGLDAYLIDRPYNQHIDTDKRVFTIQEFIARATGNPSPNYSPSLSDIEKAAIIASLPRDRNLADTGTYFSAPRK